MSPELRVQNPTAWGWGEEIPFFGVDRVKNTLSAQGVLLSMLKM
jgi:hypothetical protein